MENATKALMIAGAVLLAIMIISISLLIYNSAQGGINGAISKMSSQEKDLFNNQFLGYEGKQNGSNVKTLISAIISNNNQMTEEGTEEKCVKLSVTHKSTGGSETTSQKKKVSEITESGDLESARRDITSGKKYQVDVSVGAAGLVESITVTEI